MHYERCVLSRLLWRLLLILKHSDMPAFILALHNICIHTMIRQQQKLRIKTVCNIVTRSTKERTYVRYINGQKITKTVTPVLGEKAAHNGNVVYSLDFQVTPHQLRHTYITNLIYASVDPKTVQYLAGHENSKITMDIYAKVKYNKPEQLSAVVNTAFGQPA